MPMSQLACLLVGGLFACLLVLDIRSGKTSRKLLHEELFRRSGAVEDPTRALRADTHRIDAYRVGVVVSMGAAMASLAALIFLMRS